MAKFNDFPGPDISSGDALLFPHRVYPSPNIQGVMANAHGSPNHLIDMVWVGHRDKELSQTSGREEA